MPSEKRAWEVLSEGRALRAPSVAGLVLCPQCSEHGLEMAAPRCWAPKAARVLLNPRWMDLVLFRELNRSKLDNGLLSLGRARAVSAVSRTAISVGLA